MSWYDHPIDSLEAEAGDAVNYVETKLDTGVRWAAQEAGVGYLVGPAAPAPSDAPTDASTDAPSGHTPTLLDKLKQGASDAGQWILDELQAGPPGSPGRMTPEQRDAYEKGAENLPAAVDKKLKQATTILDALTNPWVLGGIGVVVALAVAAPYVLPFIRKAG